MTARWARGIVLAAALSAVVAAFGWDLNLRFRNESRLTAIERNQSAYEKAFRQLDKQFDKIGEKLDKIDDRLIRHMSQK